MQRSRKVTPYRATRRSKSCWGCGEAFIVRHGRAEAIVSADNRLYCHRNGCEQTALVSHVHEMQQAGLVVRAA